MDWIYLDNNATTRPAPQVTQAVQEVNEQFWANPSSVHRFGQLVRHRIELARHQTAKLINAQDSQLVFTSGGTESNNLALRGVLDRTILDAAQGNKRWQGLLITTKTEHAAIREPTERYMQLGGKVVYLPVDRFGQADPHQLEGALDKHACQDCLSLVSIQWANNETGLIQPIEALAAVCRAHQDRNPASQVVFHVDATQAVGKIPVDVNQASVDLLTLSAHKFHGPKGIGALYIRDRIRLEPQIRGGPQEQDKRGGTHHSAGIIGLGIAADLASTFLGDVDRITAITAMRDRFEQSILHQLPNTQIHSKGPDPADLSRPQRLWNTTNLGFQHLQAEAILLGLSERGLCASAGAACSSGSLEPSPVLLEMAVPEPIAHGSVRFSLSRETTEQEIDQAVRIVTQVVGKLSKILPLGV